MNLSTTVVPPGCTGVSRSSTVMIHEESWRFWNLEDSAMTSLNSLNLLGKSCWIVDVA